MNLRQVRFLKEKALEKRSDRGNGILAPLKQETLKKEVF